MAFRLGPHATMTLRNLALTWEQGQHVLIAGGTGSGKTLLARYLDQIRLDKGGSVVVFIGKLQDDNTIADHYKGWTRWTTWPANPNPNERKVLLWPKVEGLDYASAMELLKREFRKALQAISVKGHWTVHLDEGLMMSESKQLNLGADIGAMYALMRSARGTMITLAQRPANLPLSIYSNLSYAFVGYAREQSDLTRLANLGSRLSARELANVIQKNGRHDFTFIDAVNNSLPTKINLAR